MKLKLDENGVAVLEDGKPVYVHDDGKEVAFDAPHAIATITRLNGEAKGHRERASAAEAKLKAFDGLDDPDAARKALETVANLDSGKLVLAGKVEEIKAGAQKAAEDRLAAASKTYAAELQARDEAIAKLTTSLHQELIGGSFTRSKFIAEKLAIPADLVQARFGANFKIEDGKIVAYDSTGTQIFSRSKPSENASFDEAMEVLVDQYPHKESILKAEVRGGSGAPAGGGSGGGGNKAGKWDGSLADRTAAIAARFPQLST